jgi:hypothetical protein
MYKQGLRKYSGELADSLFKLVFDAKYGKTCPISHFFLPVHQPNQIILPQNIPG